MIDFGYLQPQPSNIDKNSLLTHESRNIVDKSRKNFPAGGRHPQRKRLNKMPDYKNIIELCCLNMMYKYGQSYFLAAATVVPYLLYMKCCHVQQQYY